ncbi:hypothetical protein QTP88_020702 [Uroleucon formosanum]
MVDGIQMAKNCKKQLSDADNRIDQKSIVDEASAEQSRTNISVNEVEKEKFETNLSSSGNDSICSLHKSTIDNSTYAEKTETQPVTLNFRLNEKTAIPNKDPALWNINESTIDYFALNGFDQNLKSTDFSSSKKLYIRNICGKQQSYFRYFNPNLIKIKLVNGESVNRKFIVYSEIFEQFIEIMGEKVKKTIVNEIKNAQYFSIIVDSTADISHTDQLAFIFRYVTNNGEPVERFLQFLANPRHKSKNLADAVFMVLGENEIDINNCRGQSYDNASNMSGIYSGLQARIKEACPHAVYIPCAAHSLNLVGECAANCCINANEFFNLLQNIYPFFSASTYRWDVLDQCLSKPDNVTVKRLSDTRWAARYEACLSLSRNWNNILKVLNIFINNPTENSKTKCECNGLLKKKKSLKMGILVSVWNGILERFNIVNSLLTELRKRINSYEKINTSFGFLFNITELSVLEVRQKAGELQKQYPQDLDTLFMNECNHFRGYLKGLPESVSTKSMLYLCQVMKDDYLLDIYS